MRDVVAGPAGLVAVGTVCDGSTGRLSAAAWTSTDGSAWERAPDHARRHGDLTSVVASTRAGYLAAGPSACATGASRSRTPRPTGAAGSRSRSIGSTTSRPIASINDMLFAIVPDQPTTVWTSDDGQVWLQSAVHGGPTTGVGVTEWQLASSSDTAVWLGSPDGPDRARGLGERPDPSLSVSGTAVRRTHIPDAPIVRIGRERAWFVRRRHGSCTSDRHTAHVWRTHKSSRSGRSGQECALRARRLRRCAAEARNEPGDLQSQ